MLHGFDHYSRMSSGMGLPIWDCDATLRQAATQPMTMLESVMGKLISRWFEAVPGQGLLGKARGRARRPKDARIARARSPVALLSHPGPSSPYPGLPIESLGMLQTILRRIKKRTST